MLMLTLIAGLTGAVLMFYGDMTLYYDENDYENDGTLEPIIRIMKKLPRKRVMIGGLIGPVAAFLYCTGFYHIVLTTESACRVYALLAFLFSCLGMMIGGAYHSHCAYLGLLGADEHRKALNLVVAYFQKLAIPLYIATGLGMIVWAVLMVANKTALPAWMVVFSPAILVLTRPLVDKLPKGIHMIVRGGFSNIIFIVYYVAVIVAASFVLNPV